jgi:hypothetical protein
MTKIKKNKKINKHQKVFEYILKNFSDHDDEPINLYLTYRGMKKAYLCSFRGKKFHQIIKFCKKHKLHCVYKKEPKMRSHYSIFISRNKIPENIFDIKYDNDQKITIEYHKKIGKLLGFPKICTDSYLKMLRDHLVGKKYKKNRYGHEIIIRFSLKNSKKVHQYQVYYFTCHKMCNQQMAKMAKKINDEFQTNLKKIFSYCSISYEICYRKNYIYKL